MLRLILPEWEENEMRIRLDDYLEQILKEGISALNRNENIDELVSKAATTNKLYDAVVGIGNVVVKLHKIEQEKERQISWAEVSKNSGGEGFLSAFVILSSLLYYIRRDDTDIFSGKEEGKVLIMDNPFAQTTSQHLLEPLMEMAKKTNTQLICLSGIGCEAVYNCFDNIYVLQLKQSYAREGISYIHSEHVRGDKTSDLSEEIVREEQTEDIVPARVSVGRIRDGKL
jgi:hypothetical protein